MKRITIYIAHLLVLVLTGCDKTVLEFPENEGVDPRWSMRICLLR